jgi:hypothetical protein
MLDWLLVMLPMSVMSTYSTAHERTSSEAMSGIKVYVSIGLGHSRAD